MGIKKGIKTLGRLQGNENKLECSTVIAWYNFLVFGEIKMGDKKGNKTL